MKKVCVVGGAGYVGSALCRRLMEHDLEVHCYDILLYGDKGVVPGIERSQGVNDRPPVGRYFFKPLDARWVNPKAFEGFETVFNLAGFSNDPIAEFKPALNWEMNVTAAARVAEAARAAGVSRLVYASSASIYHSSSYEIDAEIGESFKVAPHWHYSASKYAGELASLAFNRPGEFDVVALRKGTVCGPSHRMRYDLMVNTMFRSAMRDGVISLHGGGCMYRPLLSLWDAVEAYVAVSQAPRELVSGEVFNVVSENALVRDYAEVVKAWVEDGVRRVLIKATDQRSIARSYRVSARKLMERLGWSPAGKCNEVAATLVNAYESKRLPAWDDPSTENITSIKLKEAACESSCSEGGVNSAVQ